MTKLFLVVMTCPPDERALNFLTLPPNIHVHTAWVSSWPKTYSHIGLGSKRNATTQHAAPASSGSHTRSAPPACLATIHSVFAVPRQIGSSRIPTIVFSHFGTAPLRTSHAQL